MILKKTERKKPSESGVRNDELKMMNDEFKRIK
jgi:hypothetical protein